MGGRRSRPIFQIVRRTAESEKKIHDLSKSVENQDIKSITKTSGELFSDVLDFADSFIHTRRLLNEIKDKYKKVEIPTKQFEVVIRRELEGYKKKNNIHLSKAAEYNIIHAASKVIKEGGANDSL